MQYLVAMQWGFLFYGGASGSDDGGIVEVVVVMVRTDGVTVGKKKWSCIGFLTLGCIQN